MTQDTSSLAGRRALAFRAGVEQCAKCGKCRSVCPVFDRLCDETKVARGRIELARLAAAGQIDSSPRLTEGIRSCLQCLRCEALCPSGVDYESVLRGMREHLATERGVPWLARAIFRFLLPRRKLFDAAIRLAAVVESLLPFRRRGPLRHLPLFFLGSRWIPPLARRSVLDGAVRTRRLRDPQMRVTLFTGCLINYVYTRTAKAIVDILEQSNIDVVIPLDQVCCGAPVLSYGDVEGATRLARSNFRAFRRADTDAVIVACATGGKTLKNEYPHLLGREWDRFAGKIYDWAEFADEFVAWAPTPLKDRVTYHDPCHLVRAQNVREQPRALLRRAACLVEMDEPDMCCGFGGTFSLFHYALASDISDQKAADIIATAADTVATGCPGCMMHINDALARRGSDVRVCHLAEIMQEALGQGS